MWAATFNGANYPAFSVCCAKKDDLISTCEELGIDTPKLGSLQKVAFVSVGGIQPAPTGVWP